MREPRRQQLFWRNFFANSGNTPVHGSPTLANCVPKDQCSASGLRRGTPVDRAARPRSLPQRRSAVPAHALRKSNATPIVPISDFASAGTCCSPRPPGVGLWQASPAPPPMLDLCVVEPRIRWRTSPWRPRSLCSRASAVPPATPRTLAAPRASRKSPGSRLSGSVRMRRSRFGNEQLEQSGRAIASCLVAIQHQHDAVGVTVGTVADAARQRRAQGRHGIADAGLLGHQAVGIAFHDDGRFSVGDRVRAKSRPYSRLLLENSGVSREFDVFGRGGSFARHGDHARQNRPVGSAYHESRTAPGRETCRNSPGPLGVAAPGRPLPGLAGRIACPRACATIHSQSYGRSPGGSGERFVRQSRGWQDIPGRRRLRAIEQAFDDIALRPRPWPGRACLSRPGRRIDRLAAGCRLARPAWPEPRERSCPPSCMTKLKMSPPMSHTQHLNDCRSGLTCRLGRNRRAKGRATLVRRPSRRNCK